MLTQPRASVTVALMVWSAMLSEPKLRVKGGVVRAGPLLAPSRKNCTAYGVVPPRTPAVALTGTEVSMDAPFAGEVSVMLMVSTMVNVFVVEPAVAGPPELSVTTA